MIDESRKDVSGLARIRVISPTEKRSSKLLSFIKFFTDRMGQRRFANSRYAVDPVWSAPVNILLTRFIDYPGDGLIEDKFPRAFHTTELLVVTGLDRFKSPLEPKVLLD